MITNKDISIDKDGNIILNGDKYPLASQAEIDVVKGDIDDLGDTIGDITQTGITGDSVAEQLATASGDISSINATLNTKLTLVESKDISTGSTLTFDTPIQTDMMYLIVMSAAFTASGRYMKCSMIRVKDTTTNEISFGDSQFEVTVSDLKVTITNNSVRYGMKASLIKLM